MENIRKHMDVKLVQESKKFKRLTNKPNFKSFKIFSNDLVAVHMTKKEVYLSKPVYVGMSILELSKTFMIEFHYAKMKSRYGERVKLLMTDTDSFIYHIQTTDVYADMIDDLESYDTSDYPPTHPTYSKKNAKVLGKMKDEYNSRPIKEFIGLRPKLYSILDVDDKEKKKAKGVAKRATAKILHQSYREALYEEKTSSATMQQIRSVNHEVYTLSLTKIALSPYDDKRYVLDDKVTTLPFGHFRTNTTVAGEGNNELQ